MPRSLSSLAQSSVRRVRQTADAVQAAATSAIRIHSQRSAASVESSRRTATTSTAPARGHRPRQRLQRARAGDGDEDDERGDEQERAQRGQGREGGAVLVGQRDGGQPEQPYPGAEAHQRPSAAVRPRHPVLHGLAVPRPRAVHARRRDGVRRAHPRALSPRLRAGDRYRAADGNAATGGGGHDRAHARTVAAAAGGLRRGIVYALVAVAVFEAAIWAFQALE